jgi:hypothetical protein
MIHIGIERHTAAAASSKRSEASNRRQEWKMIEFKASDGGIDRSNEIEVELQRLDVQMASPNIKEAKHAELNIIYRRLSAERDALAARH